MINFKLSEMRKAGLLKSARKMFAPHLGHWQTSLQSIMAPITGRLSSSWEPAAPASMSPPCLADQAWSHVGRAWRTLSHSGVHMCASLSQVRVCRRAAQPLAAAAALRFRYDCCGGWSATRVGEGRCCAACRARACGCGDWVRWGERDSHAQRLIA